RPVLVLSGRCVGALQGLGEAVTAGLQPPVVADHAVVTGAARDPVVAVAADQIVVLAFAVKHVVALHPVRDVVAAFAVDQVVAAAVGCGLGRVVVGATERVVEQLDRARDYA